MYWEYLKAVIRRALQPTARVTDVLQILAASAAPAIARFFGVAVPTPDETLAYIGAVVVAFIILRIFFAAPYQVWREQAGEIGTLKLELTKPERIEQTRLAQIRADARADIAECISAIHTTAMLGMTNPVSAQKKIATLIDRAAALSGRANCCRTFDDALVHFSILALRKAARQGPEDSSTEGYTKLEDLGNPLLAYIHRDLTAEGLWRQLPADIAEKTRR